jgi:hypothetical protein
MPDVRAAVMPLKRVAARNPRLPLDGAAGALALAATLGRLSSRERAELFAPHLSCLGAFS